MVSAAGDVRSSAGGRRRAATRHRGLTTDLTFEQWMRDPVPVGRPRRAVSLALFDSQGHAVARFHLEHAWPSKLEIGGLSPGPTRSPSRA